jgi:catechol 2,3-dioxygenase-like lactoylglutathione lyase family enzyme
MELSLRVEVFATDPEASGEFYRRVLGFEELSRQGTDGVVHYLWIGRGTARIGIGTAWQAVDPAARSVPAGTEIVLEWTTSTRSTPGSVRPAGRSREVCGRSRGDCVTSACTTPTAITSA